MIAGLQRQNKPFNTNHHPVIYITSVLNLYSISLNRSLIRCDANIVFIDSWSRPHFYRKIRSRTGTSPNGFIRDLRMSKTLSLMKQRNKNSIEITLDIGISNPLYFTKCFHEKNMEFFLRG
ncbi:helix-turn-helix domain-containing protein [Draconibacterium mangrovi]|uniref:helix-turn-helix domain-containing protein n=1 Tax=Draconibacterium mangrovi TaxID=2697469 RepID=UPI0013D0E05F|nr:helix-turn-helix domain-containing protein [Draconibacterium mangrovi]